MTISKIDKFDRQLLVHLEKDGRLTNLALADRIGLSPTPCQKRLRRLERDGVIKGYRALVDRRSIGLTLTAFTQIRISPHKQEHARRFTEFVNARDEILACHTISGSADYLLEIVASDMDSYIQFIKTQVMELPFVASVESNFSMECIKRDGRVASLAKPERGE